MDKEVKRTIMSKKVEVKYVCQDCGSDEIQYMAWCTTNGDEVVSAGPGDMEDLWCPVCSDHTNQISEEEYKEESDENKTTK